MKSRFLAALLMLVGVSFARADEKATYPIAKVSFDDFKQLVTEVEPYRAGRLIDLDTFVKMSKEDGVIIFDSRSDMRFDRLHVKGAKHLAFTDFTQDNLAKVIPSFDTKILIYCNNNFDGNQVDFASKVAAPFNPDRSPANQIRNQEKPLMMALNIPTFINLYGYGYRNVYELHELVKVTDRRIVLEGTVISAKPAATIKSSGILLDPFKAPAESK